jgi:hypothetical protein
MTRTYCFPRFPGTSLAFMKPFSFQKRCHLGSMAWGLYFSIFGLLKKTLPLPGKGRPGPSPLRGLAWPSA